MPAFTATPPTMRARIADVRADLDALERDNDEAPRPCQDRARFIAETRARLINIDSAALADIEATLASFSDHDADQWPGDLGYLTDDERDELGAALRRNLP